MPLVAFALDAQDRLRQISMIQLPAEGRILQFTARAHDLVCFQPIQGA